MNQARDLQARDVSPELIALCKSLRRYNGLPSNEKLGTMPRLIIVELVEY
jgi:hypothetical protein